MEFSRCPPARIAGLPKTSNYGMARALVHPRSAPDSIRTGPALAMKLRREIAKPPRRDGLAQATHQVPVIVQVVDRRQHRPEHFAALVQMAQVGAAESGRAGVTGAGLVDRPR